MSSSQVSMSIARGTYSRLAARQQRVSEQLDRKVTYAELIDMLLNETKHADEARGGGGSDRGRAD